MKGGTPNDQRTFCRSAIPPRRVPRLHELDPRRVSAAGPALRGRIPSPYGGVAPRWETPDRPPVSRVEELPPPDARRSAVLHPDLPEDLRAPGAPWTLVWHGPEQSASMDRCPLACLAHGPPHPRRCPSPFSDGLGAALRGLSSRRGHRGHAAGEGGANARRRCTTPFAPGYHGFLWIIARSAAMGIPSCVLASQR